MKKISLLAALACMLAAPCLAAEPYQGYAPPQQGYAPPPCVCAPENDEALLIIIDEAIRRNSPLGQRIIDIGKSAAKSLDAGSPRQMLKSLQAGAGRDTMNLGADALRGALGQETGDAMIRQGEKWLQSYRSFLNGNGTGNSSGGFDPYSPRGNSLWKK